MEILDMVPDENTVQAQLLRLGLIYDSSDTANGTQTWCNYNAGLRCDFAAENPEEVTFTDIATRLTRTVKVADLAGISAIRTYQDMAAENAQPQQDATADQAQSDPAAEQ